MITQLYMLAILLENTGLLLEAEIVRDLLDRGKGIEVTNELESKTLNKKVYYGECLPQKIDTGTLWFDINTLALFMYVNDKNEPYWIAVSPIKKINILEGDDPANVVYFYTGREIEDFFLAILIVFAVWKCILIWWIIQKKYFLF